MRLKFDDSVDEILGAQCSSLGQGYDRAVVKRVDARSDSRPVAALISAKLLVRDCLSRELSESSGFRVLPYMTIDEWAVERGNATDLILFFVSSAVQGCDIGSLASVIDGLENPPRFAIVADSEVIEDIQSAFDLGACAYIPTSVTREVMIEVVRLVLAGGSYFPSSVLRARATDAKAKRSRSSSLTPRENAVLKGLSEGRSNKVIAQDLGLAENTIKVHVHRIMKKLNVRNRTQVALYYKSTGIKASMTEKALPV